MYKPHLFFFVRIQASPKRGEEVITNTTECGEPNVTGHRILSLQGSMDLLRGDQDKTPKIFLSFPFPFSFGYCWKKS